MDRPNGPSVTARIALAGLVTPADLLPLAALLRRAPVRCDVDCSAVTGVTGPAYVGLALLVARAWRQGAEVALGGGSDRVWEAARRAAADFQRGADAATVTGQIRAAVRGLKAFVRVSRRNARLN